MKWAQQKNMMPYCESRISSHKLNYAVCVCDQTFLLYYPIMRAGILNFSDRRRLHILWPQNEYDK